MKVTTAWANVVSQNLTLRVTTLLLTLWALVFSIATVRLALRDPLIIERECFSKAVSLASTKHSPTEIEGFVATALPKRFDTTASDTAELLSEDESRFRTKEQEEFARRGVTQRILINSTKVDGASVNVDADRVLSVGKIKSAIPFLLVITLGSVDRSPSNPYGLIIQRVAPAKAEVSK